MSQPSVVPEDFKSFVALYKEKIYEKICEYLPSGPPEQHHRAVRCYVDRKGQYRRPACILLWTLLHGGRIDDAILPAATQQASEDWILIHDDWMDGNELRRGGPTAHIMFGPLYAVNAGDHLHMITWKMARDAAEILGPIRGNRYFEKFYEMMTATAQGQYLDANLTHDMKDVTKFTPEDYYKSIYAKTAVYSVFGPMQCGAIVAGASLDVTERIKEYGVPAGIAFQVKDDILDCSSTEAELGKSIGNDVREGVKTIILWHSVQNASPKAIEKLKTIYSKNRSEKTDEEIHYVLDTFRELGSLEYAEKEATRFTEKALGRFDDLTKDVPDSNIKRIARESIGHVTQRTH
jgi:geranylgeranyl pyrophosphate synthase